MRTKVIRKFEKEQKVIDRDANEMNDSNLLPKHSDIENINSLLLNIGGAVYQDPSNFS